ncbi:MAG: triose-phosphate isomerase [Gammaproteobacteria bacterium]|nr:triose-phosphate isomerase [Gammaproteobacteria bacterium]
MHKKLVIANWKMNGTVADIAAMVDAMQEDSAVLNQVEVSLCVPAVFLNGMNQLCASASVSWGAQNVSDKPNGAFTGEISAKMLHEVGCRYVIVGHSERRLYYGEDNHWVAQKWLAAREAGLIPVLCVGESLEQKEKGHTLIIVTEQLDAVLKVANFERFSHTVIAYEPVWAIGSGLTPTANEVLSVHTALREHLIKQYDRAASQTVRILYGGSVKGDNARQLLTLDNVDGGLIGGASLKYDTFAPIYKALL